MCTPGGTETLTGPVVRGRVNEGRGANAPLLSAKVRETAARRLVIVATDVKTYDQTMSALHFDPTHPLPVALVRKLLKARIAETEGGGAAKSSRAPRPSALRRAVAPSEDVEPACPVPLP